MDRTLFEQECAEVFEEEFKNFPMAHFFFHNLDRDKSGSVVELWQELLTEFPIDKNRTTFEFLGRVIQSHESCIVQYRGYPIIPPIRGGDGGKSS